MYMNLHALRSTFKGEIDTSDAIREKYYHDASIFEIKPEVVVYPKDVDDLKSLVNFATKEKKSDDINISLTARSAGTDMSGGSVNDSIIVDFTRHINHVIEVKREDGSRVEPGKTDGYAITEPGVFYRDFEVET